MSTKQNGGIAAMVDEKKRPANRFARPADRSQPPQAA
jgi:hypothetical protein